MASVDFSARTVISPDPNLKVTEVGVPELVATRLTYPEKVNRYNIYRLKKAVLNGVKYPGANYVRKKTGENLMLKYGNKARNANLLDIGDVVERHLLTAILFCLIANLVCIRYLLWRMKFMLCRVEHSVLMSAAVHHTTLILMGMR